jgi:hypothetical protein
MCVIGFILPYTQLIPLILEPGFSFQMLIDDLFVNRVSTIFAFDLFVTAMVFVIFALYEGVKIKIRFLWIPFLMTFLVGASLGFPLFLYLRETTIEKKGRSEPSKS